MNRTFPIVHLDALRDQRLKGHSNNANICFQADKDKKIKKKKAKEDAPAAEEAPAAPAAAAPASGSDRQSSRGSRKAKRTGSNVFSMFTQKQVAEFKEVSATKSCNP